MEIFEQSIDNGVIILYDSSIRLGFKIITVNKNTRNLYEGEMGKLKTCFDIASNGPIISGEHFIIIVCKHHETRIEII